MKRSLRLNLLVGTTVASAIVLGCLGVGLYVATRETLLRSFDAGLRAKARTLEAMVEEHDNQLIFEFDKDALPEFGRAKHPWFFEMWAQRKAWQRSAMLGTGDLEGATPGDNEARWVRLKNGHAGRVVVMTFRPRSEDEGEAPPPLVTVGVAGDMEDVEDQLADEMWIVGIACAAAVVVSGLTLMGVVNRALRPVEEVGGQIERLREGDLSMRVDATGVPAELVPVVERLNGLLGRLETAFERERGFTADAAHELRTPLAGMKATLEVCRSRSREEAEYAAAIDKSLAMVGSMQRMVENLLMLARAEGGQLPLRAETVDVRTLIEEEWESFAKRAEKRGIEVKQRIETGCLAQADEESVRTVLVNLFDNAVSYVDDRGTILISTDVGTKWTEVSVTNTGSALDSTAARRVFERFWRHDSARSQTGVHAGLGLSLCERLVRAMGGRIGARSEGGVFVVRVELPLDRSEGVII